MKRIFKPLMAALLAANLVVWSIALTPGPNEPSKNKYEMAQKQVVLLESEGGAGSGTMFRRTDPAGKIHWFAFTACHVVNGALNDKLKVKISLRTPEGSRVGFTQYYGTVIAKNDKLDVALLEVVCEPDANFLPTEFASDVPARIGDSIFVVGNPLAEFSSAVTTGTISQVGVSPERNPWRWFDLDGVTAPIYPGNSGGPVFNSDGKCLGLVVCGYDATLGFFVPIRLISAWASIEHLEWAVRGESCPAVRPKLPALPPTLLPPPISPAKTPKK